MKKPNLVYILADDMGYGDLSCLNPESKIHTQNIDRLGRQGMAFTDAHATSAVCTPSRYGILTGRYNWRSTLKEGVYSGYSRPLIEDGRLTIAQMLKEQGYRTGCFGKWHLGLDWTLNGVQEKGELKEDDVDFSGPVGGGPLTRGFDRFFGISASLDMPPYVYIDGERVTALPDRDTQDRGMPFWRQGPTGADFVHEDVLPRLTEEVITFIKESTQENKDEPFFAYFPLPAPHTPILPTAPFKGKSGTNAYGDFCLQVDDTVGQVMRALEECGVAEDTIVVFTADNGCSPMADLTHLAALGHRPSHHFRGHKADIYEGGHRVPLVISWPQSITPDSTCHDTVCLVDLLATMAEILGVKLPDDAAEDSVSNLKAWSGQTYPGPLRQATVHHSVNGSFSIRQGKWKLELCPGSGGWSYPRPGNEPQDAPPIQLYDLESDVSERLNVQDQHPEVVAQLKELLADYVRQGRSTPGAPQSNTGPLHWPQLNWLAAEDLQ
jgi:arylsulfatase A